ncbi:MAG TPA: symmetrical bis(5'-nucleosyl)-tetraphosphatase [Chromatiales bacterium]|nr:symmetrical bis(5'-nucleosyl)-tetraphosphatase [Chromatiales bacterium]
MALYAVGDVQGCLDPLQHLLERARFDPARDRLWLVGDLVNRGPRSLETLRFVRTLGAAAKCVLGNHDLALLAKAAGARKLKRHDLLRAVIEAPDAAELLDWLRHRPVLHHDPHSGWTLIHAGLPPQWDETTALQCARELEQALRGPDWTVFMRHLYGDQPMLWDPRLTGWDRLRFITNCFTRLRYCTRDGRIDLTENGPPGTQGADLMPWFEMPGRRSRSMRLLFGHWSTLGLYAQPGLLGLDTGCVWGGYLTLARIDGERLRLLQTPCAAAAHPNRGARSGK